MLVLWYVLILDMIRVIFTYESLLCYYVDARRDFFKLQKELETATNSSNSKLYYQRTMCITQLPQQLPTVYKLWPSLLSKFDNANDIKIDNQIFVQSSGKELHRRLEPAIHIHHLQRQ